MGALKRFVCPPFSHASESTAVLEPIRDLHQSWFRENGDDAAAAQQHVCVCAKPTLHHREGGKCGCKTVTTPAWEDFHMLRE